MYIIYIIYMDSKQHSITLPQELSDYVKSENINLSRFVQDRLIERKNLQPLNMESNIIDHSNGYINKSQLKKRHGWSEKIIDLLNLKPDKIIKSQHYTNLYGKSQNVFLYSIVRISEIEQSNEFKNRFKNDKKTVLNG